VIIQTITLLFVKA